LPNASILTQQARLTHWGGLVAFALALTGTAQAQIQMGVAGPFSGPNAAFGMQLKNGASQAVAHINAAGGLLGEKITVSIGDRRIRSG
jgi:branched-chain amino acid transport system substrate-binding protein